MEGFLDPGVFPDGDDGLRAVGLNRVPGLLRAVLGVGARAQLYRRLWDDPGLREICDIEDHERPYHPSQLTRFRRNVGPERLEGIMKDLVGELVEGGVIRGETVAMDATFIKAYSKRDLQDNSRGHSDPDARMGRDGRSYSLGYRAHISGDSEADLPVAYIVAPANENEKKHARAREWRI